MITLNPRFLLAASLLLAAGLRAEGEPADHLFPADKDGAPAPVASLDAPPPEGAHPLLRAKITQLKEAGITREDMQRIRTALEQARDDESVKAARAKAESAREKLRAALRAYAEANGVELPEKFRPEGEKDKPQLTPEQIAERRARKQALANEKEKPELTPEQTAERRARKVAEAAARKPEISPEKVAEIRKVMEGARNDPAVKAAFEETRAAGEALRLAVRDAMLKADPSLAPLVEKLGDLRDVFRDELPGLGLKRDGSRGQQPGVSGEKKPAPAKQPGA